MITQARAFFEVRVLWIHDYRVGACRVLCNPRRCRAGRMPLPESLRFDAGLVVEVVQRQVAAGNKSK